MLWKQNFRAYYCYFSNMLKVDDISFSYKNTPILKHIRFNVKLGEHVSIIGKSGCGKSTLLKLIYGEYDLDSGAIFWKDQPILGPQYNLVVGYDFMKYVAQEFDLMPFISVEENIGKHLSNFYPKQKKTRIDELLNVVELQPFAKTKVKYLSGGQKQRVALARALAKQPEIILLDEPFSHIDTFKKQSLRRRLFEYLKQNKISCIVATHDREDVLGYADKILVLDQSKIIDSGTPENLYKNPKTALIASFFEEYNVINSQFVYASQLKVFDRGDLNVSVKKSFYRGNHYLIESIRNNGDTIFFRHSKAIETGTLVSLKIVK